MANEDPFTAAQAAKKATTKCGLCKQVDAKLNDEQVKQLRAAMRNRKIDFRTIREVLKSWGVETSETVLQSHNYGKGKCQRLLGVNRKRS